MSGEEFAFRTPTDVDEYFSPLRLRLLGRVYEMGWSAGPGMKQKGEVIRTSSRKAKPRMTPVMAMIAAMRHGRK